MWMDDPPVICSSVKDMMERMLDRRGGERFSILGWQHHDACVWSYIMGGGLVGGGGVFVSL